MRGRLTRLRSGAWLRRQRALFVPCVAMLLVSATLWLTLSPPQGGSVSGVSFFTLTWILIVGSLIVWRFSEDVIRDSDLRK